MVENLFLSMQHFSLYTNTSCWFWSFMD